MYCYQLKKELCQQSFILLPSSVRYIVVVWGVSLGINLLPEDGKFCTFDCIYCECGFNEDHRPQKKLPTREQVREALEARLIDMQQNGPKPDVLTFCR